MHKHSIPAIIAIALFAALPAQADTDDVADTPSENKPAKAERVPEHLRHRNRLSEEDRAAMRERWEGMSESERAEARERMRERRRNVSDEERQARREQWQAMTEEEREAKKQEMRAKREDWQALSEEEREARKEAMQAEREARRQEKASQAE